ncbi:hypothetical protein J6590_011216 [Homalodisca vitripennis]|nr:hypothetical protein J6590_011216 [Homalodisca vitripennis]
MKRGNLEDYQSLLIDPVFFCFTSKTESSILHGDGTTLFFNAISSEVLREGISKGVFGVTSGYLMS